MCGGGGIPPSWILNRSSSVLFSFKTNDNMYKMLARSAVIRPRKIMLSYLSPFDWFKTLLFEGHNS
jgi:hypothetical protein